jgi:hypothetical protein
MITFEQQIYELRAELNGSRMTRRERADAEAELAKAIEQQAACNTEFDNACAAEIKSRGG